MLATKIAVMLRDDLEVWQKLNVTAFTVSGIAGTDRKVVGEKYVDQSGNRYLPMFKQPVLVFAGDPKDIKKVYDRALRRKVNFSIFTEDLFRTNNDEDNRNAVRSRTSEELEIVGLAMRDDKKVIDKIFRGISLHQ